MGRICCLLMTLLAMPAAALSRVELSVGHVEAAGWQARDVKLDWTLQPETGRLQARARIVAPALPETAVDLQCRRLQTTGPGIDCGDARLRLRSAAFGDVDARLALRLRALERWTLQLTSAQARVDYNGADGRIASEGLQLRLSGRATRDAAGYALRLRADAVSGQAYVEPVFLDFAAAPLQARAELRWPGPGRALELRRVEIEQAGMARVRVDGTVDLAAPQRRHRLHVALDAPGLEALAANYLAPALAGTRLQDLSAQGAASASLTLENGTPRTVEARLADVRLDSQRLGLRLEGLDGDVRWQAEGEGPPSQLHWRSGSVVALPLGAAELRFRTGGSGLRLLQPARIPVLDGALRVQALALGGLGSDNPAATFDASLEPIDLALLGRTLGWPEFGGRLSGRLPGLRLQDRELSLDGALSAQVFDGEVTIDQVRILDPFGVLPRVRADVRLRRLDLEAITRAFSFGRITGRLDGDITGLRLLGWEPVAMNARLYSTPGDRGARRISQRAIDNISSIGGGPTGVLSRGVMRLFDDFAYARMGWSCVLADGVCHMDGVAPARDRQNGQPGYVLVQGRWLPRIDVIGYTRAVNWNTFVRQLAAVRQAQGIEVR